MKIIATTSRPNDHRTRYLVEISEDEIANVLGFRSTYDDAYSATVKPYKRGNRDFDIGTEIQVAALYKRLSGLRDRQRNLDEVSKTLHDVADLIAGAMPVIVAALDDETKAPTDAH